MTPAQDKKETLGQRALQLRLEKGLTRPQLAALAGCTATHVYHIESERRKRMRPETIEKYARALGVSPIYLQLGYDPVPEPDNWPTVSVLLRHTSELSEGEIRQVERFVQALEMQHHMDDLAQNAPQGRVTDLHTGEDV